MASPNAALAAPAEAGAPEITSVCRLVGAEVPRPEASPAEHCSFEAVVVGTAETNPSEFLSVLAAPGGPLSAIQIPREILALAEEIADGSDVPGLERSRLEFFLRMVLFLDRQGSSSRS
jgi:hypothetical protein